MDAREEIVRNRLAGLTHEERRRIWDNIDRVCFDTFNFNANDWTFCPLAIAKGLDQKIRAVPVTPEIIFKELAENFNPVNALKGVPGKFYHGTPEERKADLLRLLASEFGSGDDQRPASGR